jgi:hypothetical protein
MTKTNSLGAAIANLGKMRRKIWRALQLAPLIQCNHRRAWPNGLEQQSRFRCLATAFFIFQFGQLNRSKPQRATAAVEPRDVIFNEIFFRPVAQASNGENTQAH